MYQERQLAMFHERNGIVWEHRESTPSIHLRQDPMFLERLKTMGYQWEGLKQGKEIWISHYSSNHLILVVGDGDFSFASSLATAFGTAYNIVATSLDSKGELYEKYGMDAVLNISNLVCRGALVCHGVDARNMAAQNARLQLGEHQQFFDRIVYNFPHAGFWRKEDDAHMIAMHKELVRLFFANAVHMLLPGGEVHVAHKMGAVYEKWRLEEQAQTSGLSLIGRRYFSPSAFPGYRNRRGASFRAGDTFNSCNSATYIFAVRPFARKYQINQTRVKEQVPEICEFSSTESVTAMESTDAKLEVDMEISKDEQECSKGDALAELALDELRLASKQTNCGHRIKQKVCGVSASVSVAKTSSLKELGKDQADEYSSRGTDSNTMGPPSERSDGIKEKLSAPHLHHAKPKVSNSHSSSCQKPVERSTRETVPNGHALQSPAKPLKDPKRKPLAILNGGLHNLHSKSRAVNLQDVQQEIFQPCIPSKHQDQECIMLGPGIYRTNTQISSCMQQPPTHDAEGEKRRSLLCTPDMCPIQLQVAHMKQVSTRSTIPELISHNHQDGNWHHSPQGVTYDSQTVVGIPAYDPSFASINFPSQQFQALVMQLGTTLFIIPSPNHCNQQRPAGYVPRNPNRH